ncbi:MAG: hypothetical protein Kow0099_16020 [Candidatus Abyssubacteria bacterium]
MWKPARVLLLSIVAALLWPLSVGVASDASKPPPLHYGKPKAVGALSDWEIKESSGLARSLLNSGAFWTHNDSGDVARVFLIGPAGKTLATYTIRGAVAVDWEDIASFKHDDYSCVLVADVGDNTAERKSCTLYIVREPVVDPKFSPRTRNLRVWKTISFTYEDGPRDCEAVAVDPVSKSIFLAAKSGGAVYELPWPERELSGPMTARVVGSLGVSDVTAMDISPDGMRAIVLTYHDAYEYVRGDDEPWPEAFSRGGRLIPMPPRIQGESICYGPDGKTLYLTSEGVSQPLWEVSPVFGGESEPLKPHISE